jgi:hypothetical protein
MRYKYKQKNKKKTINKQSTKQEKTLAIECLQGFNT